MKMWKDLSPEEKGALLLAHHKGKEIQYYCEATKNWVTPLVRPAGGNNNFYWGNNNFYRVKPVPVIRQVVAYGGEYDDWDKGFWSFDSYPSPAIQDTHKIMFNLVDGEVDCSSVKMERL